MNNIQHPKSNKKIVQPAFRKAGAIRLKEVAKYYNATTAIKNLSLDIAKGETLALLGPSGCGKTTTLRLIAGLEVPAEGEVWFGDSCMSSPKKITAPHKRKVGMVFQDLALWPHMTVAQHIEFALPKGYRKKSVKQQAVAELLTLIRLEKPDRYPNQLSGGEQQRLALGRALAGKPRILLLDEPFSSLDGKLKQDLLSEVKRLIQELTITAIYVTHQKEEALYLADKISIMNDGVITQNISAKEFRTSTKQQDTQPDPQHNIISINTSL